MALCSAVRTILTFPRFPVAITNTLPGLHPMLDTAVAATSVQCLPKSCLCTLVFCFSRYQAPKLLPQSRDAGAKRNIQSGWGQNSSVFGDVQ
jgi:hypothetical protein